MADVDFSDIGSMKTWFEMQSPRKLCAMASRAALRVMANVGTDGHNTLQVLTLCVFRANLTSAVCSFNHTNDIREKLFRAAKAAALAADSYAATTLTPISSAQAAAKASVNAAISAADAVDYGIRLAADAAAHAVLNAQSSLLESILAADSSIDPAVNATAVATRIDSGFHPDHLLNVPVWSASNTPEPIFLAHGVFVQRLYNHPDWSFWADWYRRMWDGTYRDWDLAIEVALIPNEVWEGEDAVAKVAEAIREIEAKRALSSQIKALREAQTHTSADTFRPARGHNNPPELIDEPQLVERVEIVWTALDTLGQEAEAETPDKDKALQALVIVRDWFFAACTYVGRKADLMIDTTIKWGIPVLGGGYFATHPDKLQKIIELAEIWLKP